MTQVSDYLSLITSEHQKPNFLAMVSVLAQWAVDRQALLQSIRGTEAVPGSVTLDVVPSADASFYRTDWQGTQLLYATPRANLVLQSQAFANTSSWGQAGNGLLPVSGNAGIAPDGTNTASLLTEDTTNGIHTLLAVNALTITAGSTYAVSVFAKAGMRQSMEITVTTSSNGYTAKFDLVNGVVLLQGATGTGTLTSAAIDPVGNGWFRCSCVGVVSASATTLNPRFQLLGPSNGNSYAGDGVSGLYLWGAQVESNAVTSYIPTTTAPVTVTDYAVNDSGLVTLGQIPAAAAQITWSGDATVIENGGPVQASNALLGIGNGALSQFQAALTWGTQAGTPEIPGLYDIDIAVGQQLDRIGEWVGISRQLAIPLTNVYFSFDETGLGFDQGTWLGPFDPTTGLVSLPDDVYRILLYAKIAANTWDGTIPTAYTAWNTIFEPLGYQILIQNNQDMTMDIALIGPAPDAVTLALFSGGYLSLIPAGVGVNNYYLQSVQNAPLFGFDAQNDSIAGFDTGAFAQILQ